MLKRKKKNLLAGTFVAALAENKDLKEMHEDKGKRLLNMLNADKNSRALMLQRAGALHSIYGNLQSDRGKFCLSELLATTSKCQWHEFLGSCLNATFFVSYGIFTNLTDYTVLDR